MWVADELKWDDRLPLRGCDWWRLSLVVGSGVQKSDDRAVPDRFKLLLSPRVGLL